MEQAFGVDSTLVAEVLLARWKRQLTLDPVVVAAFTLDRLCACSGLDLPGRLRFVRSVTAEEREPVPVVQEHRLLLCDLLGPQDGRRGSLTQEQAAEGERLADLLVVHEPALRAVFSRMGELAEHGKLWLSQEDVLGSLAHMHVNRLLGIGTERERSAHALWRHTLESVRRRGLAASARG
jgi:thiopeptide-type bacteriocin biosynthesis protein